MTWRAEVADSLDQAIEDEIRRELDSLDLGKDDVDVSEQDSYFPVTQDIDSSLGDADIVDDVVKIYAHRLGQRTSLLEKELLECNDLLDAAKNHSSANASLDSWKLVPVLEGSQPPLDSESVRQILAQLDEDTSSSEDGLAAIEWPPNYRDAGSLLSPRSATPAAFGTDELVSPTAPAVVTGPESMELVSRADAGELGCAQSKQEHRQLQCDQDSKSPTMAVPLLTAEVMVDQQQQHMAAASAAAAVRERYKQAALQGEQVHEDLKRRLLAAEEDQGRRRAERAAKLQHDAEHLKKHMEEQENQLQRALQLAETQLSTFAAELQEQIHTIDSQLLEEKASLRSAILDRQLQQQQLQLHAAITVQAAYRGHRVRKVHGARLRERLTARHEETVARRVQELDAERQAVKRRRQEAEEERQLAERKRAQEEEERRRRAAEEEERRRRAAEELAARKAEEEQLRQQKEAERLARKAEKARLKKIAQEEAALRKAKEKEMQREEEVERRRRATAEAAAAAERERQAKLENAEKERIVWQLREEEAEPAMQRLDEAPAAGAGAAHPTVEAAASNQQQVDVLRQSRDVAADSVTKEDVRCVQREGNLIAVVEAASATQRTEAGRQLDRAATAVAVAVGASGAAVTGSRTANQAPLLKPMPALQEVCQSPASAAAETKSATDQQCGTPVNSAVAVPSSGAASSVGTTAALSAAQPASMAAAKQHSEKRLAEMQLLKERMEKMQSAAAAAPGSRSTGNAACPTSATATSAATAATSAARMDSSGFSKAEEASRIPSAPSAVSLDLSLIGSKMEERRMRWMKECTPWSSVRAEAGSRRAPLQPKKYASKKTGTVLETLPENIVLAAAGDGITSMQQLQAVQLEDLPGYSLSVLSNCRSLKAAIVRRCALTSLDDFLVSPGASDLRLLDCQVNSIDKLPAACFESLTVVDLASNQLTSMAGLEACRALRSLTLAKNKLTRIAGLAHLRSLHTLDLSYNQLISTKGVGEAVMLQVLDVSHNHLSAVDDVDKLCLLEILYAQGNNIRDIPRLVNAVLLQELQLSDNSIATLGSLSHSWLPLLSRLAIGHNSLSALVPLHGCPLLKQVDLCHNQLVDVHNVADSLKFCVNIEELLLVGTPAACRPDYRVQLLGLLPRVRLVDGVTLREAVVDELYPSDFLRECANHRRLAEKLRAEWAERTRIPGNRKLTGAEIMSVCAAHAAYFDSSSSGAEDSRSVHEYGELGSVHSGNQPDRGSGHAAAARAPLGASSAVAAAAAAAAAGAVGVPAAAPLAPMNEPSLAAAAATAADNIGTGTAKPQLHKRGPASSMATAGGSSRDVADEVSLSRGRGSSIDGRQQATENVLQSGSRAAAATAASSSSDKPTSGMHASRNTVPFDDLAGSDDEIAAVGSANRTTRHTLSKMVANTSAAATATSIAGGAGMPSKPAELTSAAAATVESKEAFEERLRAALESTSRRLLQSDGVLQASTLPAVAHRQPQLPAPLVRDGGAMYNSGASPGVAGTPKTVASRAGAGIGSGKRLPDSARAQVAATRIQAAWRGHALRKRLHSALRHARVDLSDDENFSDYGEVDVTAFDLEEARLDENWLPSQTPQLPRSYAALPSRLGFADSGGSGRTAADILTITSPANHEPHPPVHPRHAWRSQSSTSKGSAAFDLGHSAADPSPPTPALSGGQSHRSGFSRKEEMLAEEWGFKDQRTAELMVQRAKKLKYDAINKKKLRKLDPQQKLAFLRRLEESGGAPAVHVPPKKGPPKKAYFEAMEAEARQRQMEQQAEEVAREQRLYEWVHTQVGNHFDDDEDVVAGATGRRRVPPMDGQSHRHQNVVGQDTLPYIERRLIQGGRAQLVASPLDVQSVDSVRDHSEAQQNYKRMSEPDLSKDSTQLPPIKNSSASSSSSKKERISFRDQKVDLGPGWGGGRKRSSQR